MTEPPLSPERPPQVPPAAAPPASDTAWVKYVVIGCISVAILAVAVIVIAIVASIAIPSLEKARRQSDTAGGQGDVHRGSLGPGDLTGVLVDTWYDEYPLAGAIGDRFVITMASEDFDAYLQVVAPDGDILHDDDSGGGTDARLEVTLDTAGSWRVWAKTLRAGESGDYTLTIEHVP